MKSSLTYFRSHDRRRFGVVRRFYSFRTKAAWPEVAGTILSAAHGLHGPHEHHQVSSEKVFFDIFDTESFSHFFIIENNSKSILKQFNATRTLFRVILVQFQRLKVLKIFFLNMLWFHYQLIDPMSKCEESKTRSYHCRLKLLKKWNSAISQNFDPRTQY